MRAVRNDETGLHVVERPEPEGEGTLIDIASCGICGTDLGYLAMGPLPFTLGHEFAGYVEGVPYAVEPLTRCGQCVDCLSGNDNRCSAPSVTRYGNFFDGALAERLLVADYASRPCPRGLSIDDASLVETMAVAYRGVRLAAAQPGEQVCVVGGGAIGLAAVGVARHKGLDVDLEARRSTPTCRRRATRCRHRGGRRTESLRRGDRRRGQRVGARSRHSNWCGPAGGSCCSACTTASCRSPAWR